MSGIAILAFVALALAIDVILDPDRRAHVQAWWRQRRRRKAKQLREAAAVLARMIEVKGGHRPRPDGRPRQPPRGSLGVPPKPTADAPGYPDHYYDLPYEQKIAIIRANAKHPQGSPPPPPPRPPPPRTYHL